MPDLRERVAEAVEFLECIQATCQRVQAGEAGPEWASTIGLSAGIAEQGLRKVIDELNAGAGLPIGGGPILAQRRKQRFTGLAARR